MFPLDEPIPLRESAEDAGGGVGRLTWPWYRSGRHGTAARAHGRGAAGRDWDREVSGQEDTVSL
jgi:hypothetical protein